MNSLNQYIYIYIDPDSNIKEMIRCTIQLSSVRKGQRNFIEAEKLLRKALQISISKFGEW